MLFDQNTPSRLTGVVAHADRSVRAIDVVKTYPLGIEMISIAIFQNFNLNLLFMRFLYYLT